MEDLYDNLINDPRVTKYGIPITATLLGLQALRYLNRWASQRSLNNYVYDKYDWSKEIVVVTGGASGIGQAIASALASRKVRVIVLDRNKPTEPLDNVHYYSLDITDQSAVSSCCAKVRADHGSPTVLVNNAGIGIGGLILDVSPNDTRTTFDVNVFAHWTLVKEFLPDMVKNNHGHVVTVASMASFASWASNVDYAASKAAVLAFHEGLALECALYYDAPKIRTTIVHPTFVNTPMVKGHFDPNKLDSKMQTPEDVAKQIVDQLYSGNSGQIFSPPKFALASGIRGWPHWMQIKARRDLSIESRDAMLAGRVNTYSGRAAKNS